MLRIFNKKDPLPELKLEDWAGRFEEAARIWSRYTRLSPPKWCLSPEDEKKESLSGTFAMIKLEGHVIVISLRIVREYGLWDFPLEIMAHEIGHHVYAPGDLKDNARLLARIRAGLPGRENTAPMVANLYTDLLINDRLQRAGSLDMAGIYRKIKEKDSPPLIGKASDRSTDELWALYMHIYEVLWGLKHGELTHGHLSERILADGVLGARLIRAYAKDWLDGSGRFAALVLPYLMKRKPEEAGDSFHPLLDAEQAGESCEAPDGMAEVVAAEAAGAVHPSLDPELSGIDAQKPGEEEKKTSSASSPDREKKGGEKGSYRPPQDYVDLMHSLGVKLSRDELIIKYYRERALPHLISFPKLDTAQSDPYPEGLDLWEPGDSLSEIDWLESSFRSPSPLPGFTTFKRTYGHDAGDEKNERPPDIYIGIDCSGSMKNPQYALSYPVLAGTIIALSALRAKASVMAVLSGEPGEYSQTEGFIRNPAEILKILTGYLGTGYSFGIERLKQTFLSPKKTKKHPHILIISDADLFFMINETKSGWDIMSQTLDAAKGGGTCVLNLPSESQTTGYYTRPIAQLREIGWNINFINDWADLVIFARDFSKLKYGTTRLNSTTRKIT